MVKLSVQTHNLGAVWHVLCTSQPPLCHSEKHPLLGPSEDFKKTLFYTLKIAPLRLLLIMSDIKYWRASIVLCFFNLKMIEERREYSVIFKFGREFWLVCFPASFVSVCFHLELERERLNLNILRVEYYIHVYVSNLGHQKLC